MGYDEHGHCPMLVAGKCSIYEQRPRTCRSYDCRVFAASGLLFDDPGKSSINEQVSRWQFQLPEEIDQIELEAVRRATAFLEEQEPGFSVTERTLAAIERHRQFLAPGTAQDEEAPEQA
jgi:Fe-S-cluster containining protein